MWLVMIRPILALLRCFLSGKSYKLTIILFFICNSLHAQSLASTHGHIPEGHWDDLTKTFSLYNDGLTEQVDFQTDSNGNLIITESGTGAMIGVSAAPRNALEIYDNGGNQLRLTQSYGGGGSDDTGPVADTSLHTFSIAFNSDTEVQWFVDGATQGTISTNVPTSQLQMYYGVRTEEATAHYSTFYNSEICQDAT